MDAEFLKRTVGDAVSQGLLAIGEHRPLDPIEYLGEFLLRKADVIVENKKLMMDLNEMKPKLNSEKKRLDESEANENSKKDQITDAENQLSLAIEQMSSLSDIKSVFQQAIRSVSGVSSAFVAKKDGNKLSIILADATHQNLIGKVLIAGSGDGSDDFGEDASRIPVSFDCWRPVEKEADGSAPTASSDGEASDSVVYPEFIHIPNAIRNSRVTFFGVPRLGGYLAVPINLSTIVHSEGIQYSEENSKYERKSLPRSYLLGIDTIGQNRPLSSCQINNALKIAKGIKAAHIALENRIFDVECKRLMALAASKSQLSSMIVPIVETLKSSLQPSEGADDAANPTPAAEKAKKSMNKANEWLRNQLNLFENVTAAILPPSDEIMGIITSSLHMMNVDRSLYCDGSNSIDWPSVRSLLYSCIQAVGQQDLVPLASDVPSDVSLDSCFPSFPSIFILSFWLRNQAACMKQSMETA